MRVVSWRRSSIWWVCHWSPRIRIGKIAIATKTDLAESDRIAEHLLDIAELGRETGTEWAEIVPVSAQSGDQVQLLADILVGLLPEGPPLYPDGDLTDAPEEQLVAELIREAALEGVRDELPHSIAVVVEETQPVTAPPPPYVEIESTAIAAGIGARFGGGVLLVAGEEHPFTMKGLSLGDLGVSRIDAEGSVANLEDVSDFAGRYVAVEAGAAAGKGVSTLTMRNEKGVVITLQSELTGAQLSLGGQALEIELQ